MAFPLDGIISCKGLAYSVYNLNVNADNTFLKLGTVTGFTGAHVKIECLLGNSNTQGNIPVGNSIDPRQNNLPIVLTIYGSFHDNATNISTGTNDYCNFEGFYTVSNTNTMSNAIPDSGIFVEYNNNHYTYSIYLKLNVFGTNLNYFVYLPNNCTWVNDGNAYGNFLYSNHYYQLLQL